MCMLLGENCMMLPGINNSSTSSYHYVLFTLIYISLDPAWIHNLHSLPKVILSCNAVINFGFRTTALLNCIIDQAANVHPISLSDFFTSCTINYGESPKKNQSPSLLDSDSRNMGKVFLERLNRHQKQILYHSYTKFFLKLSHSLLPATHGLVPSVLRHLPSINSLFLVALTFQWIDRYFCRQGT